MAGRISDSAQAYLAEMSAAMQKLDQRVIELFAELLFGAWRDRKRVFIFGNGGSACTASHFVADFVKTAAVEGHKRLMAFCLGDNHGLTTALGNDVAYEQVFAYPLASYAGPGDLAVAISCSGNSPNVLRACEWARANGLTVVALTGTDGGKVQHLAHIHVNIPSDNFGVIEDLHMSVGHIVSQMLKNQVAAAR
jgi:D-sedoheptulose 7-phosphate isomerase